MHRDFHKKLDDESPISKKIGEERVTGIVQHVENI